jgi:hypothetical protein
MLSQVGCKIQQSADLAVDVPVLLYFGDSKHISNLARLAYGWGTCQLVNGLALERIPSIKRCYQLSHLIRGFPYWNSCARLVPG